MKRTLIFMAMLGASLALPVSASLKVGTKAPLFDAQASLGGKVYQFSLGDALSKGPVVLYFYPAAFTKGCTIEAHDFAAAMHKYHALHATVIGVSHDNIDVLKKFSVSECRSKFPVAADTDQKIMEAYDSILPRNTKYANRTSYVIAPDRTIIYTYTNLNPDHHVANTLKALRDWEAKAKK